MIDSYKRINYFLNQSIIIAAYHKVPKWNYYVQSQDSKELLLF